MDFGARQPSSFVPTYLHLYHLVPEPCQSPTGLQPYPLNELSVSTPLTPLFTPCGEETIWEPQSCSRAGQAETFSPHGRGVGRHRVRSEVLLSSAAALVLKRGHVYLY